MASVKKFTDKAVVWEIKHNERTIANSSNKDIDYSRTHLNYSLLPERKLNCYEYFKKRKSELSCYNRADVKVLAGWVVTAPKDLPVEQYRKFFQTAHAFLAERYGEINLVQSMVHMDEAQPHLHVLFIPVSKDTKHGGYKICANDVITRQDLRTFHPDLERYLKNHGVNANVKSGITKKQGGNRTVKNLKLNLNRERKIEVQQSYDNELSERGWF